MLAEWDVLSDDAQLLLAREAMRRAAVIAAAQAEALAEEIDCGGLQDRGGADALRLFAAIIRLAQPDGMDEVAGHA